MMNDQVNDDDRNVEYIGITEAEALTGIPNATLKRYILSHSQFIHFKKIGREYRIGVTEIEKLKVIRKLYNDGHKMDVVNEKLEAEGLPVTITVSSDEGGTALINVNEEVAELKNMMKLQMDFNQKLLEKMEVAEKERVEREWVLLQELQESKQLYQQEIEKVKQLLNRYESEKIAALRLSTEKSNRAMDEVSASVEVIKEELEAGREKGFFQKLFGR